MSCSKLISSCYMKFFKTLNPIRPLPIDKTSLTRSMSSAIHEAFEDKKEKVFREPKELVGQYKHYQEAYKGRLMEHFPEIEISTRRSAVILLAIYSPSNSLQRLSSRTS
jgi:hypothetical protein